MNRLPGLDLLRAVAIVWVMLFHGLRYGTPYRDFSVLGWMGVDLFFVLSGFLIGNQVFKSICILILKIVMHFHMFGLCVLKNIFIYYFL